MTNNAYIVTPYTITLIDWLLYGTSEQKGDYPEKLEITQACMQQLRYQIPRLALRLKLYNLKARPYTQETPYHENAYLEVSRLTV